MSCNNLKLKFDIIFLFELLNHSAALVSCILGASHMCSPSAEGVCVCARVHACVRGTCMPFLLVFLQSNEVRGTASPQGCCVSFEVVGVGGLIALLKVNMTWI